MKNITIIMKNHNPIAFAENELKAKKLVMTATEKHPEYWDNDAERWWNHNLHCQKEIYQFKTVPNKMEF